MTAIYLAALLIVLYKALSVIAHLDVRDFAGCRGKFAGIALFWSVAVPGAVAVALNASQIGGPLLLLALAILAATDRRKT